MAGGLFFSIRNPFYGSSYSVCNSVSLSGFPVVRFSSLPEVDPVYPKRLLFSIKLITLYYTKTHRRQRMSTAISIRIPDELAAKLAEIAEETERPKSFHIQKAIEAYLNELADLQVALDRMHDAIDPVISLTDMRKDLGL
jgi:RHH-type transcriptional regulator, rel operon repressor / antitoxin RelB